MSASGPSGPLVCEFLHPVTFINIMDTFPCKVYIETADPSKLLLDVFWQNNPFSP